MMSSAHSRDYGSVPSEEPAQEGEAPRPLSPSFAADENSPLLASNGDSQPDSHLANGFHARDDGSKPRTWWSRRYRTACLASVLVILVVTWLLLLRFFIPSAAEKYAQDAVILEVGSVSIESFTDSGVTARLRGKLAVNASRVERSALRLLGRLATSIIGAVYLKSSTVEVFLPDYAMGRLGTATFPDLALDVRNGHSTLIDIVSVVEHGPLDVVKAVLDDFVNGKIDHLRINGKSSISLKAGVFPLGTHPLSQVILLDRLPSIPRFNITRLTLGVPDGPSEPGIEAKATVTVDNNYPLRFDVPAIPFDVYLPLCRSGLVRAASARTSGVSVKPYSPIEVDVNGRVGSIPDALTKPCPGTQSSPIDDFLSAYIRGEKNTIYIRASAPTDGLPEIPGWMVDFLSNVSIPLPVPGGQMLDDLLKSFTLTDVDFSLPSPTAPPGSPESLPQLSAKIDALVAVPDGVNFPVSVSKIKADADLLYRGRKFGEIHTGRLVPAKSKQSEKELEISASFSNVPLNVTDTDVFSKVVQKIVFGKEDGVKLDIQGTADAMIEPAQLGALVVRGIPAQGQIFIKKDEKLTHEHLRIIIHSGGDLTKIQARASHLSLVASSSSSFTFSANLEFDNPTEYSATIPYLNINLYSNGVMLGNVTALNARLRPGKSSALATTHWSPSDVQAGAKFLGDYVSGRENLSVAVHVHEQTIPALPDLCDSLKNMVLDLPVPPLSSGEDSLPLIAESYLHFMSSTGSFVLNNPVVNSVIYLTSLEGVAFYNQTLLARINYSYPIRAPPGQSETPKIPIELVGPFAPDIVRKALGGTLKIDPSANVSVLLGNYETTIQVEARGCPAHVRP